MPIAFKEWAVTVPALAEARVAGGSFPFAGLAAELYGAGIGRGLGDPEFAAVLEVVEGLSGSRL